MKSNRFAHTAFVTVGLIISFVFHSYTQSAFDSGNSYFADYATRKAREAERQDIFRLGVVTQATLVTLSDGQTTPLPAGLPIKLVGEAFHNRPESFVGYLAFKSRTIAFTIPRTSVSAVERNSSNWNTTMQQYQQTVDAFELATLQAQAAAQQPNAQTIEQVKQQLELLQMLQDLKGNKRSRQHQTPAEADAWWQQYQQQQKLQQMQAGIERLRQQQQQRR